MFPINDVHKTRQFPVLNYSIIALCIVIFLIQLSVNEIEFIYNFSFIPAQYQIYDLRFYFSAFSSMWLHGGWFHLLSNMWFLHIFGDNVEDRLGRGKYILFYISAGLFSVFAQYLIDPLSNIPLLGASGAISGVTGAYFVIFKKARIKALVPTFFGFWNIIELPAWFFLGYWFVLQIFSGLSSLAVMNPDQGGVAFFAHIGGFVFGYLIAKIFAKSK